MIPPQVLYDSETTRVSVINRNTYDIYITFNGLTGINITDRLTEVMDEFKSLAKDRTTFFIADKTMSWGNNIEWEKVAEVLAPYLYQKASVTTVGLSMGGSNAILATQFFRVDKVIAFNPQYTIYPEFYPETEYKEWADRITNWRFKTIHSGFNNDTVYFLFWSSIHKPDTLFRGLFPRYSDMFDFEDRYGHNIAGDLKKDERLQELFDLCVGNRVDMLHEFTKYNKPV